MIVVSMDKPPKLAFSCITALRRRDTMSLNGRNMYNILMGATIHALPLGRLQCTFSDALHNRISESNDNETILKQRDAWVCIAELLYVVVMPNDNY